MSNSAKILLVDDSRTMRQLVRRILSQAGFEVEEAESGEEGLVKAHRHRLEAAVIDVEMPEMNGIQFIATYLENRKLPRVPLIAYSANSGIRQVTACLQAGADRFLAKDANLKMRLPKALDGLVRNRNAVSSAFDSAGLHDNEIVRCDARTPCSNRSEAHAISAADLRHLSVALG